MKQRIKSELQKFILFRKCDWKTFRSRLGPSKRSSWFVCVCFEKCDWEAHRSKLGPSKRSSRSFCFAKCDWETQRSLIARSSRSSFYSQNVIGRHPRSKLGPSKRSSRFFFAKCDWETPRSRPGLSKRSSRSLKKHVIGRHPDPGLDRPSGAPEFFWQNVIGTHPDHSLGGAPGVHFIHKT